MAKKMYTKAPIIAIDFDGTIVSSYEEINVNWHLGTLSTTAPIQNAIPVIKLFHRLGFRLILWTCRCDNEEGQDLAIAKEFLEMWGILDCFETFNENVNNLGFKTSNKIVADFYIDDRAYDKEQGKLDWLDVFIKLCEKTGHLKKRGIDNA